MVDFLRMLVGMSILAGLAETALCLQFSFWYFAHGPRLRREAWQSTASVDEAKAFVEQATWDGPLVGRLCGDAICLRRNDWSMLFSPRLLLLFEPSEHGAVIVVESRAFLGGFWLLGAVAVLIASDIHFILGITFFGALCVYTTLLWRNEAKQVSRLAPLRAMLREIGVRICPSCGYDLHGLEEGRTCPECGCVEAQRTGAISAETIRQELDERSESRRISDIARIVFGIPICFLGPLVISSILWFAYFMLFRSALSFSWFFLGLSGLMIPLLFRMERKTGGNYLGESMRVIGERYPDARPLIYSGYLGTASMTSLALATVIMNPGTTSTLIVEVFLTGPRMVLRGRSNRKLATALERVDKVRTAEVVSKMLSRVGGMPPGELLKDGETISDVLPSVTWLSFYGWIGVTAKVDRVFLFTESREALRAAS